MVACWSIAVLAVVGLFQAQAFTTPLIRSKLISTRSYMSMDDSTESAVSAARAFAASGFGLRDSSILSEDFVCTSSRSAYDKTRYLRGLAIENSAITRAVPDLDFRPHAFVVDETDPSIVWFKIQPTGTVSGPFSYRGEVYLPNYETVEFPLQQLSVQIQGDKVRRVSAGYVIDRLSGNTGEFAAILGSTSHGIRRAGWIQGSPQRA